MILFAAAMMVSFAACGGGNSNKPADNTGEAEQVEVIEETVTEQPAAPSGADEYIANYEKFLNDLLPIIEKVASGDQAAVAEYTQLAQDAQKYLTPPADLTFTPEQTQKIQDLTAKYTEAVQKMTQQ